MDASANAWLSASMTNGTPKCVVATGMRNEGPFIVEWVSWYRLLGFEVLVATNDCTDRSPALLDALADAGWVKHITHAPPADMPPQISAHFALHRDPMIATADWVLVCDVDEFLVLHEDASIQDFLANSADDAMGITFSWKCFGNSNQATYRDGFVHRQFRRCGPDRIRANRSFKAMVRDPLRFHRFDAHFPIRFDGDWADTAHVVRHADGRRIDKFNDPAAHPIRFLPRENVSFERAQMNHYIIRSMESFDFKRGWLSAASFHDRYTDDFLETFNKNGMVDESAFQFSEALGVVHDAAMALPGVRRLHHLCCADYIAALCEKAGKPVADDPRWRHHMNTAA